MHTWKYANNNSLKEIYFYPVKQTMSHDESSANTTNSNAIDPNSTAGMSYLIVEAMNSIARVTILLQKQ